MSFLDSASILSIVALSTPDFCTWFWNQARTCSTLTLPKSMATTRSVLALMNGVTASSPAPAAAATGAAAGWGEGCGATGAGAAAAQTSPSASTGIHLESLVT